MKELAGTIYRHTNDVGETPTARPPQERYIFKNPEAVREGIRLILAYAEKLEKQKPP